jgi:hypothetical protein
LLLSTVDDLERSGIAEGRRRRSLVASGHNILSTIAATKRRGKLGSDLTDRTGDEDARR